MLFDVPLCDHFENHGGHHESGGIVGGPPLDQDVPLLTRTTPFRVSLALCLFALTARLNAQATVPPSSSWTFRARAFIAGGSHRSSPAGYKAYSGLGLEVELDRRLTHGLGLAATVRTESREVDSIPASGPRLRQGSLEFLPTTLLLQWHPRNRALQPYLGVGATLTVAWEKTGVLDSLDVAPAIGPAIQVGLDIPLSTSAVFNVDLRWNGQRSRVQRGGTRLFRLEIDPLSIGLGVGFRF
jgi:outer membrane protein W